MAAHDRTHRSGVVAVLGVALGLGACRQAPVAHLSVSPDSIADEYQGSVAALLWPGATRAYQVTAAGDLFNGAWFVRFRPSCDGAVAGPPHRIAYEDRWCPVAHWTRVSGDIRWEFEAAAFPEPEPASWTSRGALARFAAARERQADAGRIAASFAGVPAERLTRLMLRVPRPLERSPVDRRNLFVALRTRATNVGTSVVDARVSMRCEAPGADRPFRDPDTLVRTPWEHGWRSPGANDSLLGLANGEVRGAELVLGWRLRPGECALHDALLPAYPTPRAELMTLARVPHPRRVEQARSYWRREIARGATFEVPDAEVRNAVRAARVVLLGARERRDVDWVPLAGPFHYRDVWIRDGARVAEALAVSGYTRESREIARGLLRFQTPLGSFVSQSGQLDGTGQVLWALEQTLLRPSPAPEARGFAAVAERAWRAVEQERAVPPAPLHGRTPGLLPETDPHDGELVRAQLVGNDAWAIVGYRATERLLRACGRSSAADGVERSRREYVTTFRLALRRTGHPDIPPSWQGIGIDWGNLNVGYPCEVLDAGDSRLALLAGRYWSPVGGPGLGYYGNPDRWHTYVAADLGTVAMLAGDRAAAERILDAAIRWRTASGGAAECFVGSTRDFGRNFPPHATAAAALVSLVRNALVFDDADTLALALGARASWWSGTRVRGAPTRWGRLDLGLARRGDVATWRWTAVPVWTLLTLPPGTRPASIEPPLKAAPRPDQVLAPPGSTRARVTLVPETRS
jgi:hypothetical protein